MIPKVAPDTIAVYGIRNTQNQKSYIGGSLSVGVRLRYHLRHLRENTHFNPKLQNAWNKYGESCFVFEILEVSDRDRIRTLESDYIQKFDSVDSGYNISYDTIAPMTGRKQTEHSIQCSREFMKTFRHSPESIALIIESNRRRKGEKRSDAVKGKMSRDRLGKKHKPISEEARENVRQAQKKLASTPERRKHLGTLRQGRKWYTNGIANLGLRDGEDIPEGYFPGVTKKSPPEKTKEFLRIMCCGKKFYNNGIVNKRFSDEEVPESFVPGKIWKARINQQSYDAQRARF